MSISQDSLTPFQLKGSLFTLTVMHLQSSEIDALESHLNQLTKGSPKLFQNMPIVIDLEHLSDSTNLDFMKLDILLRQYGLIPVGVRNGNPDLSKAANQAGLGILKQKKYEKKTEESSDTKATSSIIRPKIITQPVRSGQQIYAKGTDLIVLASVSAGSEIIADGHIHVYGTLRGRALAGVQGDIDARIICSDLAPELVSIAGRYQLQDALEIPPGKGTLQVFLQDDQICISRI